MIITSKSKIGIVQAEHAEVAEYLQLLKQHLSIVILDCAPQEQASETKLKPIKLSDKLDMVLVIGGDGTMLHAMHGFMHLGVPFYGINTGQLGFLMNNISKSACGTQAALLPLLNNVESVSIYPLQMEVVTSSGREYTALAINEISLLRQTCQTANIEISINGQVCLDSLISDGIMVATPAGSSAYNLSAGGPILPIDSSLLALTPISPFRPRRWRGALIKNDSAVKFRVLSSAMRSVSAVADFVEVRDAVQVSIRSLTDSQIRLLFDKAQSFNSRVIREQFLY